MEFQTRNVDGELRFFETLKDAMNYHLEDNTVWKISFTLPTGERVRLVYIYGTWQYEPIEV